jgi:hypothetical protein
MSVSPGLNASRLVLVYSPVNRLAKKLALLLAVLWLPIATHCDLGKLPGFEFLACCDHPDVMAHQDEDCQRDACGVVESGNYKAEEKLASAPAPLLLIVFLPPVLPDHPAAQRAIPIAASPAPPELSRIWQFSSRAALPPRAPSHVA